MRRSKVACPWTCPCPCADLHPVQGAQRQGPNTGRGGDGPQAAAAGGGGRAKALKNRAAKATGGLSALEEMVVVTAEGGTGRTLRPVHLGGTSAASERAVKATVGASAVGGVVLATAVGGTGRKLRPLPLGETSATTTREVKATGWSSVLEEVVVATLRGLYGPKHAAPAPWSEERRTYEGGQVGGRGERGGGGGCGHGEGEKGPQPGAYAPWRL